MARAGVQALGCELLAPDAACPSVTGFFPPPSVDADALRTAVRSRFGLRLAGGQGKFKGKILRIGHMGYVDPFEVSAAISAIGLCLASSGANVDTSGATIACLQCL
jgi:aspartate aminotransferase-like enzyme